MPADIPAQPVSDSQFNMIRCVLAVAHADGIIQDEERAYINKMISKLQLTDDQRDTIEKDFETPQDVIALFDKIDDPQYKSQVIHFARLMVWKDGELDPGEEAIMKKLQSHAAKGSAGFDELEPEITSYVSKKDHPEFDMPESKNSVIQSFFDTFFKKTERRS